MLFLFSERAHAPFLRSIPLSRDVDPGWRADPLSAEEAGWNGLFGIRGVKQ